MRRSQADPIDGILVLDKPLGLSSNSALQRARRLMVARKAGHTGTLDPLATGLLPITFGEATKFSSDLLDADKEYLADLVLGVSTTSGDAEGEVTARAAVDFPRTVLDRVLEGFRGEQTQVPPMFSALKLNGRPLYELARRGIEVERASRTIRILEMECLDWHEDRLRLRVLCSKGTYIRVLAHDIGTALGCGAHLGALRRTRVGALSIEGALGLDGLEALEVKQRRARLLPADYLLQGLPRIDLDPVLAQRFSQGQRLVGDFFAARRDAPGRVRVYDSAGVLQGVGQCDGRRLTPERLMATVVSAETVAAHE